MFAIDPKPIPCSESPLSRVATSAMVAKKHRIFFIDTSFLLANQASDIRFTNPCMHPQGMCSLSNGPIDV